MPARQAVIMHSTDTALPQPAASNTLRDAFAQRFDAWALARHPAGGSTRLTHRNVYILPTRTGWFFALLLVVLLVLSINYQLNLGYLLTFLLAGSAMMAMHVTHNNLRGLQLTARPPEGLLHQGQSARLGLLLQAGARDRWGLALRPAACLGRASCSPCSSSWRATADGSSTAPRCVVCSRRPRSSRWSAMPRCAAA